MVAGTAASRKAKGQNLQKLVAAKIGALLGLEWGKDKLIAPRPSGQSGTDIILIGEAEERFPFSIECKFCESWAVPKWIEQAKANEKDGTYWMLVAKRSRKNPVVIMDFDDFFAILKGFMNE